VSRSIRKAALLFSLLGAFAFAAGSAGTTAPPVMYHSGPIHTTAFTTVPHSINVGTQYSTYLAGHAVSQDNGLNFYQTWGQLNDLPNPQAGTGPSLLPADSVVQGFAVTRSDVFGGATYGLGAVWDAGPTPDACGPTMWTIEGYLTNGGFPEPSTISPEPIPAADLSPLGVVGQPLCYAPGQNVFLKVDLNNQQHSLNYLVGPNEHQTDIENSMPVHTSFTSFQGAGEGASTCETFSGTGCVTPVAQDIATGSLFSFNTFAVGIRLGHGHTSNQAIGNPSSDVNYESFEGTVNGGPPSVSNPVTLTESPFTKVGYGSFNTVTAP
jgi:hypothetical protein